MDGATMRILQICTNFFSGGIQRHALELSESLREKGHHVFLAGAPGEWLNPNTQLDYQPLALGNVATEQKNKLFRFAHACICAYQLRGFLRKNRIELIHAHESAPAIVAKLASLGLGIPILLTYHGSAPERVRFFGRIARLTARRTITPSHRCAEELHEQAGVPKSDLEVIGLGVEPPPEIPQAAVERHREKLLGPDGKLLVVMIARLAHQKGIDILVEVVRRVMEQRGDIRFVVVGGGPQQDEVKKWAADAGVDSVLQFHGRSDEPYLYLKAADLFLLTSRWEALPISIAEALQTGLPVVATDTGGVTELVAPSVGRVVPVGDVDALCASILELCGNEDLRRKMSDEAIRISREERFSIPHIHAIFERLYADILCGSR
jgi:glycosyltransferase involved in cell wall biosynthesis